MFCQYSLSIFVSICQYDEAAAVKNKMKGSEEVDRIKADVASSKRALEKLQSDYLSHQLKILELDGVKQQISGGRRHSKLNTHN